MNKLLDEELEDDEKFWNQDALKEVMSDDFNWLWKFSLWEGFL